MRFSELFSFSKELNCAFLSVAKIDEQVSEKDVLDILALNDMQDAFVYKDVVESTLNKIKRETLYLNEIESPEIFVIAEKRDAFLKVNVSEDKLSVCLLLVQAYGGKHIGYEDILNSLSRNKIKYGISIDAIKLFLKQCTHIQPGESFSQLVAKGSPPINGKEAYFENYIEDSGSAFSPNIDKDSNKIDMLDSYHLKTVLKGDPLMRLHPPTNGRGGVNVYGERIPSTVGKSLAFKEYEGSCLSKKDPNLLEASVGGQPKIFNDGVKVFNVLELENVDLHTGNIDFDGSIVVLGDVKPKMKVKVTGDLEVHGVIEDAVIDVKGALFAVKGILGKKNPEMEDLSCVINVDGAIQSDFAQYSHIESTQDIHIKSYVSHCEIITNGKLAVANQDFSAGSIIGGVNCADRGIETVYLGTDAEVETLCETFFHYIELCKKISDQELVRDDYNNVLSKLERVKEKLRMSVINIDKKEKKKKLLMVMKNELAYQELFDEAGLQLNRLKEELKHDEKTVSIKVHGQVFPGCKLTVGVNRMEIGNISHSMEYRLSHGKLKAQPN